MTTHAERVLTGRLGAYAAHSRHDGHEMAKTARAAFESKFERDVDPDGVLPIAERLRRAEMARKAHYTRLALASVQARAKTARRRFPAVSPVSTASESDRSGGQRLCHRGRTAG